MIVALAAASVCAASPARAATVPSGAVIRTDRTVDVATFSRFIEARFSVVLRRVVAADIDRDGDVDILAATDRGFFVWLNDGAGEKGRVLKAETVRMAERNGLGEKKIKGLPGVIPSLSNYAEFFPGMPKSWALTFMINEEDAPTGRPAGSLAWAGLANLYYWIDRRNGVGGFWATQILPFADPASVGGYLDFEKAVYDNLSLAKAA